MVQFSQAKQPRVECPNEADKHKKDGCDHFDSAQNAEKDFEEEQNEHRLETSNPTPTHEPPSYLLNGSNLAPPGWLLGPFIQSFKSKMASFTDIVMSPAKIFKDKNLRVSGHEPDETGGSSETEREPRENGDMEENPIQVVPPRSSSPHSQTFHSPVPDEVQMSSSQEVQNPSLSIDNVVMETEVPTLLTTKSDLVSNPPLYPFNVQLECFPQDASALQTDHIDSARLQPASTSVRSKRMASAKVRVERKRLKADTQSDGANPVVPEKKAASKLTGGQNARRPAAKCRSVKRDAKSEPKNETEKKTQALVSMRNVTVRKLTWSAQGESAPNVGCAKPTKKSKKARRDGKNTDSKLEKSSEPLYFEMTPFEGNPSQCDHEPYQRSHPGSSASILLHSRIHLKRLGRNPHFSWPPAPDGTTPTAVEDLPGRGVLTSRLSRSSSCPEIPSLFSPLTRQSLPASVPVRLHGDSQRARRHTVSGMEVEREIAPPCLRKEVYPAHRSFPCDGPKPSSPLPPTSSLSTLVSCFLSSPLAFLSKKDEGRVATADSSAAPLERAESPVGVPDACTRTRQLGVELDGKTHGEDYDEDAISSGGEFDKAVVVAELREEKSLSDSELKSSQKNERGGKVSSIRIRRTLPKAQNNLTPMGLPKAVRLKKKQFSLEEIYTNKNFSKPPESRLETILELPLNRRDGAESFFGQRRLKRSLVFPETGAVRKPKKVVGGGGKAGTVSSRTRRGGFAKGGAGTTASVPPPPDPDALLCAKLKQLDLWLAGDQADGAVS
ncbi:uncharacterized protein prr14 isoform X2 [Stigmatopora nigra]